MSGHWEPVMQWVEDDDEDFEENDDWYEEQAEREIERLSYCTCGAYVWSDKAHKMLHVADCICGNT